MGTKDRILKAARESFAEKGYDGVSVDEIARRAGVKKALIYYYFPSKEVLFEEVWNQAIDELEDHIFKEVANENIYMRKIKRFLRAYIDFVTSKKVLSRVIEMERESVMKDERWKSLKDRYDSFLSKVASLIEEGKEYNAIYDDIDPLAAADLISSSLSGRKEGLLDKIISMIFRGIFKG